jgi:preprotein translocase subunit SecD
MRLYIFAFILLLSSAASALAVEPNDSIVNITKSLNDSGKIVVKQPAELTKRLDKVEEEQSSSQDNDTQSTAVQTRSKNGYRVEVFADNKVQTAKAQAASKKRLLQAKFPQYKTYLVFEAPYWRVRLGDFTNRSAADAAMSEVRQAFPSFSTDLRVVRSTINP